MIGQQMIFQLPLQQPELRIQRIQPLLRRALRIPAEELDPVDAAQGNGIRIEREPACRQIPDKPVDPPAALLHPHPLLVQPVEIVLVVGPQVPVSIEIPPGKLVLQVQEREPLPLQALIPRHRRSLQPQTPHPRRLQGHIRRLHQAVFHLVEQLRHPKMAGSMQQ